MLTFREFHISFMEFHKSFMVFHKSFMESSMEFHEVIMESSVYDKDSVFIINSIRFSPFLQGNQSVIRHSVGQGRILRPFHIFRKNYKAYLLCNCI